MRMEPKLHREVHEAPGRRLLSRLGREERLAVLAVRSTWASASAWTRDGGQDRSIEAGVVHAV